MSPVAYKAALSRLGITQAAFGAWLGVHPVTGRRWAASGPPKAVSKLLRLMIAINYSPGDVDAWLATLE